MIRSTLCYIERDGCYLMLYRNKKKNDPNAGKWVGIGGKFEPGESAEECLLREVREETGYILTSYSFLGVVEFRNDAWEDEDMYLYLADGFKVPDGGDSDCTEGDLKWIPKDEILKLSLWAGDRYFLEPMLRGEKDLNMRLTYSGDTLISAERHNMG
ncbi:MAG: 8-oxo-dGTP diphosphatase [Lachnospiraceae bacterium]|nr:8-oxo-dGTP diphosphatase [Lachnospiraceae bacterium]